MSEFEKPKRGRGRPPLNKVQRLIQNEKETDSNVDLIVNILNMRLGDKKGASVPAFMAGIIKGLYGESPTFRLTPIEDPERKLTDFEQILLRIEDVISNEIQEVLDELEIFDDVENVTPSVTEPTMQQSEPPRAVASNHSAERTVEVIPRFKK